MFKVLIKMGFFVALSTLGSLLLVIASPATYEEGINALPSIVQIGSHSPCPQHILREKAAPLHFPLSEQDKKDIDLLKKKFKSI